MEKGNLYITSSFILLFFFASLYAVRAQKLEPHPGIRHFLPRDGLPSSEVYDLIQDQQGYIWISTDHGVSRYNGYEFELFGKEEGLIDPVVFYLFEDHRGWIWMATFQGNIYIYKNGKIEAYPHLNILRRALEDLKKSSADVFIAIHRIYVDRNGTLYVFSPGKGLIGITEDGVLQNIGDEVTHNWLMWIKEGKVFYSYSFGNPMVKEANSSLFTLASLSSENCINKVHRILWEQPVSEFSNKTNGFEQHLNDEVIFQSGDNLLLINPNTLEVTKSTPYPYGEILYYLESNQSSLVFVGHMSENRGLYIYPNRNAFLNFETQKNIPYFFPGKTISHILEDSQGGIWIATNEDGVYYLSEPDVLLATLDDARLNDITGIALANADSCFVRTKKEKVYFISDNLNINELPAMDPIGNDLNNLFYDTTQERLYRTGDLKYWENGVWHDVFSTNPIKGYSGWGGLYLSYNIISSRKEKSRLFFHGNYIIYYAYCEDGEYEFSNQIIRIEPRQRIFYVFQDISGTIYVGGMKGLYIYDEVSKQFIHQDQHPAFFHRIQMIEQLADSTLVIGTRYEGIVLWKEEQLRHISTHEGLSAPYIKDIHVDENQILWVGTNAGLNRIEIIDIDSIRIQHIGIANGLPSNEITAIDSWGSQIWVATSSGIVKMPEDLPSPKQAITPIIEQVYINGKKISQEEILQLSWRENNLRIEVVSLDYPQQGNILYRYRFKPYEPWQITSNPDVNIAQLSFGIYLFEIQAKGNDGRWSESAKLSFVIQRPLWKNTWVQFMGMAVLFALIAWRLRRDQKVKEEKTRQSQQVTKLEQQLENLRQEAYQAQMNPHFIFNCLAAIQGFILQGGNDRLVASDYLSKFARLIRQALNASRSKQISLGEDIDMLRNYIQLEQFRFHFKFDCEIEIDPNLDIYNSHVPPMLIQPYVENAILHGFTGIDNRGFLLIKYTKKDEVMVVEVEDNGAGIYQTQQKSKSYHTQSTYKHESMGMEISRQRLLMHPTTPNSGSVLVEEINNHGKVEGTRVTITIPIH